jgi:hypothetical protein
MEGVARCCGSRRTMQSTTAQKEARPNKTIACPQTILAQYERIGRLVGAIAAVLPCQTAAGTHRGVASFLNRPVWSKTAPSPSPPFGLHGPPCNGRAGQSAEAGSALLSFTGRGVARRPRHRTPTRLSPPLFLLNGPCRCVSVPALGWASSNRVCHPPLRPHQATPAGCMSAWTVLPSFKPK